MLQNTHSVDIAPFTEDMLDLQESALTKMGTSDEAAQVGVV